MSPATLKERFLAQERSVSPRFSRFSPLRFSPRVEAHPLVVRGQLEPGYVLAEFLGLGISALSFALRPFLSLQASATRVDYKTWVETSGSTSRTDEPTDREAERLGLSHAQPHKEN